MTTIDEIKSLMKSGDVAGAEALCRKALEADPDNAEIKMRYGICRELLGDEKTFKEIHDELAPEMAEAEKTEPRSEKVSLWRKYHKLWTTLIVGALVLGGAAVGVIMVGNSIRNSFHVMLYAGPVAPEKMTERTERNDFNLYAGQKYEEPTRLEEDQNTHAE